MVSGAAVLGALFSPCLPCLLTLVTADPTQAPSLGGFYPAAAASQGSWEVGLLAASAHSRCHGHLTRWGCMMGDPGGPRFPRNQLLTLPAPSTLSNTQWALLPLLLGRQSPGAPTIGAPSAVWAQARLWCPS